MSALRTLSTQSIPASNRTLARFNSTREEETQPDRLRLSRTLSMFIENRVWTIHLRRSGPRRLDITSTVGVRPSTASHFRNGQLRIQLDANQFTLEDHSNDIAPRQSIDHRGALRP